MALLLGTRMLLGAHGLLLGTRTLLGAHGLRTLLGAHGLTPRNEDVTRGSWLTTRNKDARGPWPYS